MTITRYGTSCAPRPDGIFILASELESIIEKCASIAESHGTTEGREIAGLIRELKEGE